MARVIGVGVFGIDAERRVEVGKRLLIFALVTVAQGQQIAVDAFRVPPDEVAVATDRQVKIALVEGDRTDSDASSLLR